MLPEDVWREVLECTHPSDYSTLTRQAAGVCREFYWLLKNSVTTIRVHRPVVPLCGLVWLHSRDSRFSRIKCVEGEHTLPHPFFVFCCTCPSETKVNAQFVSRIPLLAVAFPARGVDLQAVFLMAHGSRRHPIRVIIRHNVYGYTGDRLPTELAALGVEGFIVEVQQPP